MRSVKPLLVTFSGLDGAGKSTQINHLRRQLESAGLKVRTLAFWDDVAVGKRFREGFVHKVYGSEQGIGSPEKPVARRDKNVRAWYLTLARCGFYLLDAIHLAEVVARARRGAPHVIIVDRYIYDEIVNLPLRNRFGRWFARLLDSLTPRPDVPLLLDADPEAARARKPEYPLEFMRHARRKYIFVAELIRFIRVVPPLPLEEACRTVVNEVWRELAEAEGRAQAA